MIQHIIIYFNLLFFSDNSCWRESNQDDRRDRKILCNSQWEKSKKGFTAWIFCLLFSSNYYVRFCLHFSDLGCN